MKPSLVHSTSIFTLIKIIPIYDSNRDQTLNLPFGSGSDAHACNFQTGFLNGSRGTMTECVWTLDAAEFS